MLLFTNLQAALRTQNKGATVNGQEPFASEGNTNVSGGSCPSLSFVVGRHKCHEPVHTKFRVVCVKESGFEIECALPHSRIRVVSTLLRKLIGSSGTPASRPRYATTIRRVWIENGQCSSRRRVGKVIG
jgi:hypothetical protein